MTQLDVNGNTTNTNRKTLAAKIKKLPAPVRFEVQQWGRIWIALPDGVITFFADEEGKLLEWLLDNGQEQQVRKATNQ